MDHHHPFLILLSCGALAGCYGEARYHSELAEETCVLYEDCGVMEAYGHSGEARMRRGYGGHDSSEIKRKPVIKSALPFGRD